jgi:MFS family permease
MGDATLYAVLPTHAAEAGISLTAVGVVLAANRAIRIFLNAPAGMAYDRLPRRRLFVPALLLGALSTSVYGLTHGLGPLLAGRLLWGVAWSGIWVGGNTIMLDVTHRADRGRWVGAYQSWFFMGGALGFLLGGVMTDWLGYHRSLQTGAAISALGALPALLRLPETRGHSPSAEVRSDTPLPVEPEHGGTQPDLPVIIALQGANRFAIAGVMAATLSLLLKERAGDILTLGRVSLGVASQSGLLLAARMLISMGLAPLVGSLSDRPTGRWRLIPWILLTGAAGMAMLAFGTGRGIVLGAFLGAAASGGLQALVVALTGDLAPGPRRGRSLGVLHTVGDAGSAAGPLVAYALLPLVGLTGVYSLCAALFLLTLLLLWQRRRRPGSRLEPR